MKDYVGVFCSDFFDFENDGEKKSMVSKNDRRLAPKKSPSAPPQSPGKKTEKKRAWITDIHT